MKERRSIERFDLELPMLIKGGNEMGSLFEENTRSLNISSRGAYFLIKSRVREDSRLYVTLYLSIKDEGENKVDLKGKVVRIEEGSKTTGYKKGVALRFDPIKNMEVLTGPVSYSIEGERK